MLPKNFFFVPKYPNRNPNCYFMLWHTKFDSKKDENLKKKYKALLKLA